MCWPARARDRTDRSRRRTAFHHHDGGAFTSFAGQLARLFGNDRFEPVEPREEMLYLIDHHDHGRGTALFLVTFIPDIALALPQWLGL